MATQHVRIGDVAADLTPGVVDAAAVELYTDGACWYLAWTLHQLTGFPVVTLGGFLDVDGEEGDYTWVHVGVLTPDGKFLDVNGPHDPDDAMCWWLDMEPDIAYEHGMYPVDVTDFAADVTWDPAEVDDTAAAVTRSIALTVLATHAHAAA